MNTETENRTPGLIPVFAAEGIGLVQFEGSVHQAADPDLADVES